MLLSRGSQIALLILIGLLAFVLIGATNGNTWAYFTLGLCLSGIAGLSQVDA